MPSEGPVHLRRATVEDAAGIAQVHVDGWQRAYAGLAPEEYIARRSASAGEQSWREELEVQAPDRRPWVALLDGCIVGFADGGMARDDDVGSGTGEIYTLFVDPESWEKGIRTNLMEHVCFDLRAHGFERAVFWVLATDSTARAFAEHVGFRPDGSTRFEDCGGTQVEQLRYALDLR
jgi:GNAT superfamily N-acetyltransferase